jgi:hypothetical protein
MSDFSDAYQAGKDVRPYTVHDVVDRDRFLVLEDGSVVEIPAGPKAMNETFSDVDSFIDAVNTFKSSDTRLFGKRTSIGDAGVTARLDYNEHAGGTTYFEDKFQLLLAASDPWKLLQQASTKKMGQAQFLGFLDGIREYITVPAAADIITLIRCIEVGVSKKAKSALDLGNGSRSLEYTSDARVVTEAPIPELLEFTMPIYDGAEAWKIPARLRTEIGVDDLPLFTLLIPNRSDILRTAWTDVIAKITEGTDLPVWF